MKFRAKFAVIMFVFMFVLASAFIAHARSATNQMGQCAGKAVSTDSQDTKVPSSRTAKAPGPYKYNYNQRHGITNDFGQDKTGNPDTF